MPSDQLKPITSALTGLGGQRVWSLLVSVFGDLAQSKGDSIDGPVLSAIMTAMEVRPEATRVALHRLRNDGWIASEKAGRTSRHSLTTMGRAASAAASPRIYGAPQDMPTDWQLILTEGTDPDENSHLESAGFWPLMPRVYLGASGIAPPTSVLILKGDTVPAWLRAQFAPDDLAADYLALRDILRIVQSDLPPGTLLSALDRAVLRCLIVHTWRRIVLKHPVLPRQLFPPDWAGHDCRALVHDLLFRFPRPDLSEIIP